MNKKVLVIRIICLSWVLFLLSFVSAGGFDKFSGVIDIKKVDTYHPNYDEIFQQYAIDAYQSYEVTYHLKEGWNFLPYSILNGRDAVTGKASCWKQDDQRGNIGATILEYVYMYEPNASILPESHNGNYIGGALEEWDRKPLSEYRKNIWGIAEPSEKMNMPINWVYSPKDCDFLFYSGWLDAQNYQEGLEALKEGKIPCTENSCPLKLEKGWQVVLQLFPGLTWNELKGDCIVEEINFWNPINQNYVLSQDRKQENLEEFMNTKIEKEDYFKPVLMKIKNDCVMGFNELSSSVEEDFFCKEILRNGEREDKIDVVFVSDRYKYSDKDLWSQDVKDLLDIDAIKKGLLYVEPMKSNKDKFNFWRYDLLGNEFYNMEHQAINPIEIKQILEDDCKDPDFIFLIIDNTDYPNFEGGLGGNSLAMVTRYRMDDLNTRAMAHEFGHAFANLGDEYENSVQMHDYTERPNIDSEGCPKWCSGGLNKESDCYDEYIEFKNCLYNFTNDLTKQYDGSCKYRWNLPDCDLGKDCREETGCYCNAKSLIAFRSSEQSIMKYPTEDPFEFNLISKEAILNRINLLTE